MNGPDGPPDIPPGDLQVYDHYEPVLSAGDWWIGLEQTLTQGEQAVSGEPMKGRQELVVAAPQFSIDPAEVLTVYPPPNTSGEYANVLPHAVLAEPLLPWERQLNGGAAPGPVPWLALLVLGAEEIVGAEASPTRTTSATIEEFLALGGNVLASKAKPAPDVSTASPCSYVQPCSEDLRRRRPAAGRAALPGPLPAGRQRRQGDHRAEPGGARLAGRRQPLPRAGARRGCGQELCLPRLAAGPRGAVGRRAGPRLIRHGCPRLALQLELRDPAAAIRGLRRANAGDRRL